MNKQEEAYLGLLDELLYKGNVKEDRTGVGTKSIFGTQLRFSLEDGKLPLLTTKKMFVRGIIEELLFFIRGETDTKKLEEKGVNIWKGNTSREFLDKRGLKYLPEGSLGLGYGAQWRRWGSKVEYLKIGEHFQEDIIDPGIDQLKEVFNSIKCDPDSRRHIISAWNVSQLKDMALPPCHMTIQFYVNDEKLSCLWFQRSVDCLLGLPYNIASYAILTHLMAKATGLKPGSLIFSGGDTHLYTNHLDQAAEQTSREPFDFPTMNIKKDISSIEDMENLSFEDFEIVDYKFHPAIKAPMAI